jgi:hypothetical protein
MAAVIVCVGKATIDDPKQRDAALCVRNGSKRAHPGKRENRLFHSVISREFF